MAWTSPKTFTASSVLTAAELNTHLRDNLNETCPATASASGDLIYADGANSMGNRLAIGSANALLASTGGQPVWRSSGTTKNFGDGSSSQTTTSTAYTSSMGATTLPSATVTSGTRCLVFWKASLSNDTASATVYLSYSISGATTQSATDANAIRVLLSNANDATEFAGFDSTSVTAGSNTFQLEARVASGTGTIARPRLWVFPL